MVNKTIAKTIGIRGALLLSDMISKYEYLKAVKQITDIDGKDFFYYTSEEIEQATTLTYKVQKKFIDIMKEHDILETKSMGLPRKMYFHINEQKVLELLTLEEQFLPKGKDCNCPKGNTVVDQKEEIYYNKKENKKEKIKNNIEPNGSKPPYFLSDKIEKQIAETDKNLVYPESFTEECRTLWENLRREPKWRKKSASALQTSLNKLAKYPSDFQIVMMSNSLEKGWQGIEYNNTPEEFEKWKRQKKANVNPNNSEEMEMIKDMEDFYAGLKNSRQEY